MPNTGNYAHGKIYKLVTNHVDKVYIGSTCQKWLCCRMAGHRKQYDNWLNGNKDYTTSFELLRYDDCQIVLIENYPCNDKYELEARERYHIENNKCTNKRIPTRTPKEYYEQTIEQRQLYLEKNKDAIAQRDKLYREKNKDRITARKKEYYGEHRNKLTDCSKQWYSQNKEKAAERSKTYREENKEQIYSRQKQYRLENTSILKEKQRVYRLSHQEQIKMRKSQKVECDVCGACVTKNGLPPHKKTQKCQAHFKSQAEDTTTKTNTAQQI